MDFKSWYHKLGLLEIAFQKIVDYYIWVEYDILEKFDFLSLNMKIEVHL